MEVSDRLAQMSILTPCAANWDAMDGNERTRHCRSCDKNVHNLTAMSSEEIASLLDSENGGACVRVWQRADGTLGMSGCPAPAQLVPSRLQFRIRTLMGVVAAVAAAIGLGRFVSERLAASQSQVSTRGSMLMGRLISTRSCGETVSSDQF